MNPAIPDNRPLALSAGSRERHGDRGVCSGQTDRSHDGELMFLKNWVTTATAQPPVLFCESILERPARQ
jgi:hypothetical protein